ncbi:MAG: amino acid ABC transporter permease [Chloroflexi bacterium]|nr:amino acid ABC transporter permease [Chloroflexota bacterium]
MVFDWGIVREYFFSTILLEGVWITIQLSVLAQVIGVVLGGVTALGRQSRNPLLSLPANLYVWFFRGTPVYVQLLFWFAALPKVQPFNVGLLALSLNEGAYMAEIVRAGIQSVDKGQMEAAQSLGMTYGLAMRRIVLPQALRVIIPPTGNEFISMLKTSSLASAVSLDELLLHAQNIYNSSGDVPGATHVLELLTVASIYYLILTTIFSIGQSWLESRLGDRRAQALTRGTLLTRLTSVLSLGGAIRR